MPLLLMALIAAAIAGGAFLLIHTGGAGHLLPGRTSSAPIQLSGMTGFDPFGDNHQEHNNEAKLATDRDTTTAWTTEHYNTGGFAKDGVGLVLKAPNPVALSKLTVLSGGTPFEAKIRASIAPDSGYVDVSPGWQPVGARTTFSVNTHGKDYRYYLVWLRLPRGGGQAKIFEVTART